MALDEKSVHRQSYFILSGHEQVYQMLMPIHPVCDGTWKSRGKVGGSLKSVVFILWKPWMFEQNFTAIHPIFVEIFR